MRERESQERVLSVKPGKKEISRGFSGTAKSTGRRTNCCRKLGARGRPCPRSPGHTPSSEGPWLHAGKNSEQEGAD